MLQDEDNDLRERLLDVEEDNEESSPAIAGLEENSNGDDDPTTPKKTKQNSSSDNNNNNAFRVDPILGAFLAALFGMFYLRLYTKAIYNTMTNRSELVVVSSIGTLAPTLTLTENSSDLKDPDTDEQRIVILAGPAYAPDGTKPLETFYRFAGQSVWLDPAYEPESLFRASPHPAFSGWSYPVGIREEYRNLPDWPPNQVMAKSLFHSPLHEIMAGPQRSEILFRTPFQHRSEQFLAMTGYYRDLFQIPWSEGKNLVLGIENLAGLFREAEPSSTGDNSNNSSRIITGEARHIDPLADDMLDRLLDAVLLTPTPEIEVVIDYRTPRIENAIEIWKHARLRRMGNEFLSFRDWLAEGGHAYLWRINTLGMALQLCFLEEVRGIRVTLVDSARAAARASANNDKPEDHNFVATPLEGIVACDILGINANQPERLTTTTTTTVTMTPATTPATSTTATMTPPTTPVATSFEGPIRTVYCDAQSRLHLPKIPKKRFSAPRVRPDPGPRNVSPSELEHLESILEEYDCGIWRYLRAYRAKGILRVLPEGGEDPFENCPPHNDDDDDAGYETPSFKDTIQKIIDSAVHPWKDGEMDTYNSPSHNDDKDEETPCKGEVEEGEKN